MTEATAKAELVSAPSSQTTETTPAPAGVIASAIPCPLCGQPARGEMIRLHDPATGSQQDVHLVCLQQQTIAQLTQTLAMVQRDLAAIVVKQGGTIRFHTDEYAPPQVIEQLQSRTDAGGWVTVSIGEPGRIVLPPRGGLGPRRLS